MSTSKVAAISSIALQATAYHGHEQVICLLLQSGADVCDSEFSNDAFHAAAEEITQALIVAGEQQSLLIHGCSYGNFPLVDALLEAGADMQA